MNEVSERQGDNESKDKVIGAIDFAMKPVMITVAVTENDQRHNEQTEIKHDDVHPVHGVEHILATAKSHMQLV